MCSVKISFFTWDASWGKFLTLDKLPRTVVSLVDICYSCQQFEESVDRFLIHCSKSALGVNVSPCLALLGSCQAL